MDLADITILEKMVTIRKEALLEVSKEAAVKELAMIADQMKELFNKIEIICETNKVDFYLDVPNDTAIQYYGEEGGQGWYSSY